MHIDKIHTVYFIGVGGIGMSALARYFKSRGKQVSGYDKTATSLTQQLETEGISIHYEDWGNEVLTSFQAENTLVVYTAAIPKEMGELEAFQSNGYPVFKRAEVLGYITQTSRGIGVAGTHGKTTTSTLLAHVLHNTLGCNAFLGGISSNYETNLLLDKNSEWSVIEADEFDRSFLHLHPFAGVLTSVDADHLDIYQNKKHLLESFLAYIQQINSKGFLLIRKGIQLSASCRQITYAVNEDADISGQNLRYTDEKFCFDVFFSDGNVWKNVTLGIPGIHNAENALAVIGIARELNILENDIRANLLSFKGVKRRFEYQVKTASQIYIDDYAHHPNEIKAFIRSVRMLYPDKKILGIFQPHLYTRTRDFMQEFAHELNQLDEIILMPIYPARELPIEGITSEALATMMDKKVHVLNHNEILAYLTKNKIPPIVLTIGAGNVDTLVQPLKTLLQ
jgi:UDP-N-acetylmuramate--alanine ligase